MACCVSSRHIFLFLFTLLFVIDVISDILAVIQWYRLDYFIWFLIGTITISISFIMQWLYCLNNMNSYLKYLQTYKYSGWNAYNHYLNFDNTHYIHSHSQSHKQRKINKCKEMTLMIFKFLFKSVLFHFIFQFGIIEAFIKNCIILNRYNNNKNNNKKNIFNFDPKNNYNSISKYPNPVLQFNKNYLCANFSDLCILHCYFQSVIMALLHCTFFLSQFVFQMETTQLQYSFMFSLYLIAFISSMLSLLIFAFNFEKSAIYPSYFEFDNLSQIKYIFPHLYLYPSTSQIYQITNNNNDHHNQAPPTCHYASDLPSSPSDIYHHNTNNNKTNKFGLFLCKFTFYVYLFCDFSCRTSPFILSFIQLSISINITNPNINVYLTSQWLFWINIAFLCIFTFYLMIHFIWLHRKYSDYFKPSAPFWRYTIKKYLKCHYIHPLRSILDTEPLFAFFLRNCLFWFCVIIICNISIFGLIFNRSTLYSPKIKKHNYHKIRKQVESSIIRESLIRYFCGFIIILLMVIFDSYYNNKQFYFVAVWTFIYCIFALYCSFIILKISHCSLLRIDGIWIEKVRKRGWILSRNEEGLIWHRNYNKAQSFTIKKMQKKNELKLMQQQNKMYHQHKIMNHTHNNVENNNNTDDVSSSNAEKEVQIKKQSGPGVVPMVGLSKEILINNPVHAENMASVTNIAITNAANVNEQQKKCLAPALAKTLKPNDCSNDTYITITENINVTNNIKINDTSFDTNSITNTTVNSSNINVKISCINPHNIINNQQQTPQSQSTNLNKNITNNHHKSLSKKSLSSHRPKPSILRTITTTITPNNISPLNNILRPSSSEPPPSTSTQRSIAEHLNIIHNNNNHNNNTILAALSTSPPHYPPPQLSIYAIANQQNNINPRSANIFRSHTRTRSQSLSFEDKAHIGLHQITPVKERITMVDSMVASGNTSSSNSSRRIMLMDEEQSDESENESSAEEIAIIHPNCKSVSVSKHHIHASGSDIEIFREMLQKQKAEMPHLKIHMHAVHTGVDVTPKSTEIFTPNSSGMFESVSSGNNMNFDPFSEPSISGKLGHHYHVKNGWSREITSPELNAVIIQPKIDENMHMHMHMDEDGHGVHISPTKQMVTIKWPHKHVNNEVHYNKHAKRLSWSESDIKYPLKWLMNQPKQVKKHNRGKKKKSKRQLKSIHHLKTKERKQKIASSYKKHAKITLTPMDENMDTTHAFSPKRASLSQKHSLSSLSNSRSKDTGSKSAKRKRDKTKNKKRKHFSLSNDGDMGSIDEIGALIHHSSDSFTSDTVEYNSNIMNNTNTNNNNISSPPKSKSMSINTSLSFDNINHELNSMDSALSLNIQNTNTKLFDTLRKLSAQQNKSNKGSYHNIPTQIRHEKKPHIIYDNSSDDSVVEIKRHPKKEAKMYKKMKYNKQNKSGTALLAQSYTNHVGDEVKKRNGGISSPIISSKDNEQLSKHNYKNSDINTLSSNSTTVSQSLFNIGCNIE